LRGFEGRFEGRFGGKFKDKFKGKSKGKSKGRFGGRFGGRFEGGLKAGLEAGGMGDLWLLVPAAIGKGLVLSPGSVFFTILFATQSELVKSNGAVFLKKLSR
jgi:hypothetical protein